jgi:uncharacterized DUF497 family protein
VGRDKADRNARKHEVTFEEAATVFSDPLALIIEDERHPENARIIGESLARRATRHERSEQGE